MQMYKLKHLTNLSLTGLNLSGLPRYIQKDPQKIISYFKSKSMLMNGFYRMKLMLVGKQNRGKSTLAARLQGKSCGDASTVGVDISEWEHKPFGKKTFQFSVWDFGGQEEYYATHQCFLSERAIYIVLFSLTHGEKGVEELFPWLNNIALRAPKSSALIVATHLDEIPVSEREQKADKLLHQAADIASKFTRILNIYQVLAVGLKEPFEGVANLRSTIYQCAAEYKLANGEFAMGQNVPVSYSKLNKHIMWYQRQAKQCKKDPVMNTENFKAFVKELNLNDLLGDDDLQLATTFLTEIGTLLHYDDRSHHLDELYFLDPQWLCDMMSKIVTVRERNPFVSNGVLATKDIPLILHGEQFPWQYFKQIFALLDRFEIAFSLDRHKILIPSMLAESQPERVTIIENTKKPLYTRIVIFNSPLAPSGFWSRLICRIMHAIPKTQSLINQDTFDFHNFMNQESVTHSFQHNSVNATPDSRFSISVAVEPPNTVLSVSQPNILYWKTGLFYEDNDVLLRIQSLEHTNHKKQGVEIAATSSTLGKKLVSQVLDCIGALVKDWYPGLCEGGSLNQVVLCCKCVELHHTDPFQFDVQSCFNLIGKNQTTTYCKYSDNPAENHSVLLADIVPDLLLQDINMKFLLNITEIDYKQDDDSLLGTGGFGKVYRGKCHGKSVAIKTYLNGDEALNELRREAIILQKFHHPCLVCLVGVCVNPIMAMVLEEAPMGSLEKPLIKQKLSIHRLVIHRIAVQVAAALNFLHDNNIIFRDLKAANVLLWSLDPESLCHCKVTDFGISTSATPLGARGITGTKGFMAPEVLHIGKKKEHTLYDHTADLFSYGMLLYQMISRRNPFHDMLPIKIDSAIEGGERPRLDDSEDSFFFLKQVMQSCWQADPCKRPTTNDIVAKTCHWTFQSVMTIKSEAWRFLCCNVVVVSEKVFSKVGVSNKSSEIWLCSNSDAGIDICTYSTKGLVMTSRRIIKGIKAQCVIAAGEHVIVSSNVQAEGTIDIFNIMTKESVQQLHLKNHKVSCMTYLDDTIYCGTFEGYCLAICKNMQQFYIKCSSKHMSNSSIDGIVTAKACLWLSHECNIHLLNLQTLETMKIIKRDSSSEDFIGKLYRTNDGSTIWACQLIGTCISAWNMDHEKHNFDIDIKKYLSTVIDFSGELEISITTLVPILDTVWVGLESGYVVVFHQKQLLFWFQPYNCFVQFLVTVPIEDLDHTEKGVVISGGNSLNHSMIHGLGDLQFQSEYGTLIKWEAFPSKTAWQISLVQSHSSTFLKNHRNISSIIQAGAFKDCTFLEEDNHSNVATA